jgi:hypothetical protein
LFLRGRYPLPLAEARGGERAMVHAANHEGRLEAVEVMVTESPR